jgi:hypothetical protein
MKRDDDDMTAEVSLQMLAELPFNDGRTRAVVSALARALEPLIVAGRAAFFLGDSKGVEKVTHAYEQMWGETEQPPDITPYFDLRDLTTSYPTARGAVAAIIHSACPQMSLSTIRTYMKSSPAPHDRRVIPAFIIPDLQE